MRGSSDCIKPVKGRRLGSLLSLVSRLWFWPLIGWPWCHERVGGVWLQLISAGLPQTWYETLHLDTNKESLIFFYLSINDHIQNTLIHVKCLLGCFETQSLLITFPSLFSPCSGLQTGLRPALESQTSKVPPPSPPWLWHNSRKIDKEGNCRPAGAGPQHEMESVLTPNIAPIKQSRLGKWRTFNEAFHHQSRVSWWYLKDTSPNSLYHVKGCSFFWRMY